MTRRVQEQAGPMLNNDFIKHLRDTRNLMKNHLDPKFVIYQDIINILLTGHAPRRAAKFASTIGRKISASDTQKMISVLRSYYYLDGSPVFCWNIDGYDGSWWFWITELPLPQWQDKQSNLIPVQEHEWRELHRHFDHESITGIEVYEPDGIEEMEFLVDFLKEGDILLNAEPIDLQILSSDDGSMVYNVISTSTLPYECDLATLIYFYRVPNGFKASPHIDRVQYATKYLNMSEEQADVLFNNLPKRYSSEELGDLLIKYAKTGEFL